MSARDWSIQRLKLGLSVRGRAPCRAGTEPGHEIRPSVGEALGRLGEGHHAGATLAVQALVVERGAAAVEARLARRPASGPDIAAHLEHVAEVGGELDRHGGEDFVEPMVGQADVFVQPPPPDQPPPLDVKHAGRHHPATARRQGTVGAMEGEDDVVRRHARAEQGGAAIPDQQP
jgi:hypothetical protein